MQCILYFFTICILLVFLQLNTMKICTHTINKKKLTSYLSTMPYHDYALEDGVSIDVEWFVEVFLFIKEY